MLKFDVIYYALAVFREKRFWYSVKYVLWCLADKIRGVDYVKNAGYAQLGTSIEESSVFQATRDIKYLDKVIDWLEIKKTDSILDLGSGKGYLLKLFSQRYHFDKVGGVEISSKLCDIAKHNLDREGVKNYTIYNENAKSFVDYLPYTHIYMFNPFPAVIVREVMKNLSERILESKKNIYEAAGGGVCIIYKNPVCHDVIIESGVFQLVKTFEGKTKTYNVYRSC